MHIIFDFDGTLVDSKDYILEIYNSISREKNRPYISKEVFERMSSLSIYERFKIFNTSLLEVTKIYHEIEEYYFDNAKDLLMFNGIKDLIIELSKSNKLYILSTNTKRIIKRVVEHHGLIEYFENFYSNRNLFGKASTLKRIIKNNKLDRRDIIYVGDEERDVVASKKAKISVISVVWGFDSKELLASAKPSYIANTPDQILEYIENKKTNEKN